MLHSIIRHRLLPFQPAEQQSDKQEPVLAGVIVGVPATADEQCGDGQQQSHDGDHPYG